MAAAFAVHLPAQCQLWQGNAKGADAMAVQYWESHGLGPVAGISARWDMLGGRAGHVRNGLLVAQMPDMLIAFPWDGRSPGTWDAIAQARDAGIPTYVYRIRFLCPAVVAKIQ